MKSPRVFVDTNVLFPASLADLTLSSAEYGLFELVYSDHLLEEVQRVLVDNKGLAPANAQRFIDEISATFPWQDHRLHLRECGRLVDRARQTRPDASRCRFREWCGCAGRALPAWSPPSCRVRDTPKTPAR